MAAWTLPHKITEWCENLTTALDRRSRKYFVTVVLGMVLSTGRRTVSSWLRAAGVSNDWQDHYYFLQTVGRSAGRGYHDPARGPPGAALGAGLMTPPECLTGVSVFRTIS